MNTNGIYAGVIACGSAAAAWAFQNAREMSSTCSALVSQAYNQCYSTTVRQLGGGVDLFDTTSWFKGMLRQSEARSICSSRKFEEIVNCEDSTPYVVTAVLCSAVVICAMVKICRR